MIQGNPAVTTRNSRLVTSLLPLLVFILAAAALYPYYRFRIVSDDISYLTIARRYLAGDYATAVNAYWSPLNIWLLVLLVKATGWALLPASYVLNCTSFATLLLLSIRLCRKFVTDKATLTGFGLCAALFWAGNIPVTHFADALNAAIMTGLLLLLLRDDFTRKKIWWLAFALLSAIAYFSKAYSFYIIPLTTAVVLFLLSRRNEGISIKKAALIWSSITAGMLIFIMPWLYLLHHKYGIWTLSTAGAINTSWALKGHIYFSDQYPSLVPPAYTGSLSCWEDMWINRGDMLSSLGSVHLMKRQLFRAGMNVLQWFKVICEFSPMYFPAWLLGILYLANRKVRDYEKGRAILILTFLLFPAGYLLLSYGTRYLWFTVPLVMISGLISFREYLQPLMKPLTYRVFLVAFFLSWFPGLVYELRDSFNEGKNDYEIARRLEEMNIKGSFFTSNYDDYQSHFRISWFSGNQYYMHFGDNRTTAQLLAEANRLGVKYYFYFYKGNGEDYRLMRPDGQAYPEVTAGSIEGLKVFQLR